MIEKDFTLINKVADVLGTSELNVVNTPFVEIIEMLVMKLEVEKKQVKVNQYQDWTARTAPHFDELTEEITAWTMGIAGESGEVADFVKKCVWHNHPWDHKKLALELGDLMYYIARLSNVIGYSLEDICLMNQAKLYKRYPNGFDSEKSINREED